MLDTKSPNSLLFRLGRKPDMSAGAKLGHSAPRERRSAAE